MGNVQENPLPILYVESCVTKELSISPPVLAYKFLSRRKFSTRTSTHPCTAAVDSMRRTLSVFEIVHQESVKGSSTHVQRESPADPLCAASCVTTDIPISPRFSPTIFYRQANSARYKWTVFYTLQPRLMHPPDQKLTTLAIKNVYK